MNGSKELEGQSYPVLKFEVEIRTLVKIRECKLDFTLNKILYKKIWRLSLPPMNLVRCTTKSSPHSAVPKPLSPSFLVPLVSLPLSRGSPAPSPRCHGTEVLGRRRWCGLGVKHLSIPMRRQTWSPPPSSPISFQDVSTQP